MKLKRKKSKSPFSFVIFLLFLASIAKGENIQGTLTRTINLEENSTLFLPEEIVAINLADIPPLLGGIEIRLSLPPQFSKFQRSFALMIFGRVTPAPQKNHRRYQGTRVYMRLLPGRDSIILRIPLEKNHHFTGDALTDLLPNPLQADQFPLLLSLHPVVKGIPDSALREKLSLSLSPLWRNEGIITVHLNTVSKNSEDQVILLIDGKEVLLGVPTIFPAGLHRIQVKSNQALSSEKTIALEPGQSLNVDWELDYSAPEITIKIPPDTLVSLDGQQIADPGESNVVILSSPGEHLITYHLGRWELSRQFTVLAGEKLSIDFFADIIITNYGKEAEGKFEEERIP